MSRWLLLLSLSGMAAAPLPGASQAPQQTAAPRIQAAQLAWMSGHWAGTRNGADSEEHWTSPAGGVLVGMHKDVKAGRVVGFEYLRIEPGPDGAGLAYVASPQGGPATAFAMLDQGEQSVAFENRAHDFPQRINYWLDSEGALHARIEGSTGGLQRHLEWVWTRVRP